MSSANSKQFDVVIFGATGFTGQLVAEYFARHVPLMSTSCASAAHSNSQSRYSFVPALRWEGISCITMRGCA